MRISDWSSDVCSADLLDLGGKARGRAVDHDRGRILSPCRPLARRRLRVDVVHKGGMPGILGGGGQVHGEGGFPCAALLADDREIGRAPCRASVCLYVSILVVAVFSQNQNKVIRIKMN